MRAFKLTNKGIVYYYLHMNEIQRKIVDLRQRGWTLAALGDALGNHWTTLAKWQSGDRYPANAKSVLFAMEDLMRRQRIPKQRRYSGTHHLQRARQERERGSETE